MLLGWDQRMEGRVNRCHRERFAILFVVSSYEVCVAGDLQTEEAELIDSSKDEGDMADTQQ